MFDVQEVLPETIDISCISGLKDVICVNVRSVHINRTFKTCEENDKSGSPMLIPRAFWWSWGDGRPGLRDGGRLRETGMTGDH